ncbi:MAG: PIG-L family deacetylase [Anaerolineae bacterium]
MSDFYAHVYLSPHLDDAALSCGGLMHRQVKAGSPPLVITLFSGQPPADAELSAFARWQHERWGHPQDVMPVRWAEDQAALAVLGADYLRLNYRDCIYRGREHGPEPLWYYASEEALFGPVHPAEQGLPGELAITMSEFIPGPQGVTLYAPLAAGNHVDHQLTCAAALILRAQGWRVCFYEDYPYVEAEGILAAALIARGAEGWQPVVTPLDENDLAAKVEAIACYASQLGVLFGGAEAMRERVRGYAIQVGGERLWNPDAREGLLRAPRLAF